MSSWQGRDRDLTLRPPIMRAAFLASLLFVASTHAALRLQDGEHVKVNPKPEDEVATIIFSFKNEGTKPVKVVKIESACSCLSATVDSAVYQPGQVGTGKAEFKVSAFTGEQEKNIVLTTDDTEQPEWVIPFIVNVPELVKIEPKMVQWMLNEAPTAKDFTVTFTGKDEMKVTGLESSRENMSAVFKEVKPGREYRVTLTPKTTDGIMIGVVKVITDSKIPKYARQLGFFGVVRAPEARKAESASTVEVIAKPAAPESKKESSETILKPDAAK
jgi:hypothetical protein